MSYRRLFHLLFTGSTLALAGLWWISRGQLYAFDFSSRGTHFTVGGSLYSATVGFSLDASGTGNNRVNYGTRPISEFPDDLVERYGLKGGFCLTRDIPACGGSGSGCSYHVGVPIWVLYLLFVGCAHVFVKRLEKRSTAIKEKALAEQHAADHESPVRG